MKVSDFEFDLPRELIARKPLPLRSASRLLHLDTASESISHHVFRQLPDLLNADDILIFNNTRVIPARLFGKKKTGGRVEILIERVLNEREALAQIRANRSPGEGSRILIDQGPTIVVTGRQGEFYRLRFPSPGPAEVVRRFGHIPLPPYIDRSDTTEDRERYQTIYAKKEGAVAAPTAGLHFDAALLELLGEKGIGGAEVTLHTGAGTFQPVRTERLEDHTMHPEYLEVDGHLCIQVKARRSRGGRVVAVGTTSVRSLETAAACGELRPYTGDTKLFIYPGYRFRCVDALITNFHLPGSTLMMLVSAFAGIGPIRRAYQAAIEAKYRFYSYGDAMLITR